jgi:hypothetical protein
MKVTTRNGRLIINLPIEEPRASASGKTLVVASSRGVRTTDVKIGGNLICVNVNAFVYPTPEAQPAAEKPRENRRHER